MNILGNIEMRWVLWLNFKCRQWISTIQNLTWHSSTVYKRFYEYLSATLPLMKQNSCHAWAVSDDEKYLRKSIAIEPSVSCVINPRVDVMWFSSYFQHFPIDTFWSKEQEKLRPLEGNEYNLDKHLTLHWWENPWAGQFVFIYNYNL